MELEEMQLRWQELSAKVNQQHTLTDQLILSMTQQRYHNKFQQIKNYETAASCIAVIMAIAVLVNIEKLDSWYLLACGIFTAAYLLLLPPLVLISINRVQHISISNKNYKETLLAFAKARHWLLSVQRLAMLLNFILMLAVIPVAVKLIDDKDIFEKSNPVWWWMIPIMTIALSLFSTWGYRMYQRKADAAEQLIKELDN